MQVIDLKDHPHNDCRNAWLAWSEGGKSLYSVKAGWVAVIGFDAATMQHRCFADTFTTKAEARAALQGV